MWTVIHGRIAVDGRIIALAINHASGGHYTYIAKDRHADTPAEGLKALAGRKLTGPRRPIGSYEADLAQQIIHSVCK